MLTGTNLDAPDANLLAGFYRRLLGWTAEVDDPGWVVLRPPGGGHTLNFQTEPQPQEDVRVCLDPAGHPFCLYIEV